MAIGDIELKARECIIEELKATLMLIKQRKEPEENQKDINIREDDKLEIIWKRRFIRFLARRVNLYGDSKWPVDFDSSNYEHFSLLLFATAHNSLFTIGCHFK